MERGFINMHPLLDVVDTAGAILIEAYPLPITQSDGNEND
jgi:hypothetical protein